MDIDVKILLVDDEVNILRSVSKTLRREGYEVEIAENNTTAFELVKKSMSQGKPFNLVILDLNMPNFSGKESKYAGLELLDRLNVETPDTPVIINSAWDEVETAKTCIDQGAVDYFVKGRTGEMLQKIRTVLGEDRNEEARTR